MTDIFVSYSRKDKEIVKKLVDVLKSRGWSVWWDPTIRAGEYFEDVIEKALFDCKCVIVVWSQNSVKSKWVRAEAAEAANRDVMVPVVIDDARIPFRFKQIQEARLVDWQFTADHPELTKLLESIAQKLLQPQTGTTTSSENDVQEDEVIVTHPPRSPIVAPQHEPSTSNRVTNAYQETPRDQPFVPETAPQNNRWTSVTRSQFVSKRFFVAALLVVIAVAAGLVYVFALRDRSNELKNDDQQKNGGISQASPSPAQSSPAPGATPAGSPGEVPANSTKLVALLKGQWHSQTATTRECECASSACLDIQFNKVIPKFCIEDNNVFVSAYFRLDKSLTKAFLFYRDAVDLSAGANQMPWDRFDRAKPLATIDLADLERQKVIYVTWHGFTEKGAVRQKFRQIGSGFQGTYLKR